MTNSLQKDHPHSSVFIVLLVITTICFELFDLRTFEVVVLLGLWSLLVLIRVLWLSEAFLPPISSGRSRVLPWVLLDTMQRQERRSTTEKILQPFNKYIGILFGLMGMHIVMNIQIELIVIGLVFLLALSYAYDQKFKNIALGISTALFLGSLMGTPETAGINFQESSFLYGASFFTALVFVRGLFRRQAVQLYSLAGLLVLTMLGFCHFYQTGSTGLWLAGWTMIAVIWAQVRIPHEKSYKMHQP